MEVAINLNVKLSIVIATIGRDSLIQSIESIAYSCKLASETYEIIVVIDNPDVDSNLVIYLESVLQMDRLIINPVNLGAVKSFNIGLEKAKGELSAEDKKLAAQIINTAKAKYKFNATQIDALRAVAGL